jgi:protein-S-isoprenylcysteine O-methyltransferase Ste14
MTNHKRRFVRSRSLRIPIRVRRTTGAECFGYLISLGPGGAGIMVNEELQRDESVFMDTVDTSQINLTGMPLNIRWFSAGESPEKVYGGEFVNCTDDQKALLAIYLPTVYPTGFRKNQRIIQLTLRIGIGLILPGVFIYGLTMNLGKVWLWSYLSLFAITALRIWETFLTSKERDPFKDSSDWTISAVVFYYVLMLLFIGVEITFLHRSFIGVWSIIGASMYLGAFVFRLYCMKILGKNWQIHILDDGKESAVQHNLVRKGPYRWVRHPIYSAVITELFAIPIIFGAYFALAFVLLVNIPLQILRSRIEESNLLQRYGASYASYMWAVRGLFPRFHKDNSDKRRFALRIEGIDRRSNL